MLRNRYNLPSVLDAFRKCLDEGREFISGSGAGQISFSNSSDQSNGRREVKSSLLLGRLLNKRELLETKVFLMLSGLSGLACLLRGRSKETRGLLSSEYSGERAFRANGISLELVEVLLLERI